MKKKLKIGVLFGGKSAEHDVSLVSAKNVINALDKNKYQIFSIKIDRKGKFNFNLLKKMDVVFPVLHGPYGEDGSMQGLLKIFNIPFVGPSVLGSAVSMDKDVMKRLFRDAGVPIGKFVTISEGEEINFNKIKKILGLPMFIKPANMGSSVGIHKVKNEKEFNVGMKDAFQYDSKIIVEEFIKGREFAVAMLGNEKIEASGLCEIITDREFYDYEAKYSDDNGALIEIPARLNTKLIQEARTIASKAFKTLGCEGMGRVDLFLKDNKKFLICEVNTIPGFTSHSMYPKLWEASGFSLSFLLDKLIVLAIERYEREQALKTTIK